MSKRYYKIQIFQRDVNHPDQGTWADFPLAGTMGYDVIPSSFTTHNAAKDIVRRWALKPEDGYRIIECEGADLFDHLRCDNA